ncbi:hypothetical protein FM106_27440 [Brachybacterium faecium]|nr:hypothetical protein FM106_27440 [Brachybacterium faecium]
MYLLIDSFSMLEQFYTIGLIIAIYFLFFYCTLDKSTL